MNIVKNKIIEILPLTPLQNGMLFHALAKDTVHDDPYLIQMWGNILGEFTFDQFELAWKLLIERHATFRTAFITQADKSPRQVTLREIPFAIEKLDLSSKCSKQQQSNLVELRENNKKNHFNPLKPPLLRVTLIKIGKNEWQFLFTIHHLILDGWSQSLVVAELQEILKGLITGNPANLEEPIGPKVILNKLPKLDASEDEFWIEYLNRWQASALPDIGPKHKDVATKPHRPSMDLPIGLASNLTDIAKKIRIPQSIFAFAAWALVLCRWTGKLDITFGMTVSGRSGSLDALKAVGMFVNTLPIRIQICPEDNLISLVEKIHLIVRSIDSREQTDLVQLQKLASADHNNPLFDTLVAFENFPADSHDESLIKFSNLQSDERTNLSAALVIVPGDKWSASLQCDGNTVSDFFGQQILDNFIGILKKVVQHPNEKIGSLLAAYPSHQLGDDEFINEFHSLSNPLITSFIQKENLYPNNVAVKFGNLNITYKDLLQKVLVVASNLSKLGVRSGDKVALCIDRNEDLPALMLGVLYVGALYIPLDPSNPASRRKIIIDDCKPDLLVHNSEEIFNVPTVMSDSLISGIASNESPADVRSDAPAYIIYTSGSTGQPKGVIVPHGNVLNLLKACQEHIQTGPNDIWTMFHSFAFDFSVWELFGPLLSGGSCLIVPYDISRDPIAFLDLCKKEKVTVLSQTPSAFGLFMEAEKSHIEKLSSLRHIIFGGEALILGTLTGWFERYEDTQPIISNMYGITETTVHVTWRQITRNDILLQSGSLIGKPLKHLKIELLDENDFPVPNGIAGEIHVSGSGVAIGYLNKAEQTATRFYPNLNELHPGRRRYRSGDLARLTIDGELEYLGRIDDQVKIRGFRIELGEIEHALSLDEEVKFATVGTWNNSSNSTQDNLQLCAWIVPNESGCNFENLKARLKLRLPDYMVPELLILVPNIPLTHNGKADKKNLPNPKDAAGDIRQEASKTVTSPDEKTSELETAICEIWASVLGLASVYPEENYFALGGDSIRSLSIASMAAKRGIIFEIRRLFDHPTPRLLAVWIEQSRKNVELLTAIGTNNGQLKPKVYEEFELLNSKEKAVIPQYIVDAWPATKIQCGMIFHSEYGDDNNYYIDTWLYSLKLPVNKTLFESALYSLYKKHPILRSSFSLDSERPLQLIHADVQPNITWLDLRNESKLVCGETIKHGLEMLKRHKFEFSKPGLAKFLIYQTEDDVINFIVCTHHAIIDGWSISILTSELIKYYFALLNKQILSADSAPPLQSHIAKSEIEILADSQAQQRWKDRLTQFKSYELPIWPGMKSKGGKKQILVNKETSDRLKIIASECGIPLKAWLFSAFSYLLAWSSGKNYSAVGLVVNGRPENELSKDALGLFLNTIPVGLATKGTWIDMARAAFLAEAEIYNDRLMPLAEIQKLNGGIRPFEANFNYVHFRLFSNVLDENKFELLEAVDFSWLTEIPLTANVSINPHSDEIEISILYGPRYTEKQIQWMSDRFAEIIKQISLSPKTSPSIHDPLLPNHQASQLTSAVSSPEAIHTAAIKNLTNNIKKNAVIDHDGAKYTAEEVLIRAENLSALLSEAGVLPGMAIAILLPRSLDHVVAQLAALNLGAWFVSLDPSINIARNIKIVQQLGKVILIKDSNFDIHELSTIALATIDINQIDNSSKLSGLKASELLLSRSTPIAVDALAYAIFTSGSTGEPKGVLVGHKSIASHMRWMNSEFNFYPNEKIIHRTNPVFDASIWEIWSPLMTGATLVIASESSSKDPTSIAELIQSTNATVLQLVPSILETMVDATSLAAMAKLSKLFVGGEPLRADLVKGIMDLISIEIINLYGPSETTVQCTFEIVKKNELNPFISQIPIGKPISGAIAYVINEDLVQVPTGVVGELIIGGTPPALGYLHLPDLTRERFIQYPQSGSDSIFFKTGDLVSLLPDGKLLYQGRSDRQLKIGGNRIEPAEIENRLSQLIPGQRIAIESEQLDNYSRLIAYIEERDTKKIDIRVIRDELAKTLPEYMIPGIYRFIPIWPTLTSGKTDLNALMLLSLDTKDIEKIDQSTDSYLVEISEKQEKLLYLAQTLIESKVHLDDDLFTLGLDSISAMQLVARARKESLELTPRDIFKYRTIRAIGSLDYSNTDTYVEPMPGNYPLLPAQKWFFSLDLPQTNWWNQVVSLKLRKKISASEMIAFLNTLGSRHRALSMRITTESRALHASDGSGNPYLQIIEKDKEESSLELLKQAAQNVQENLSIDKGPIWGAIIEKDQDQNVNTLILAIHHIATDGVSWRIIIDELNTLIDQKSLPKAGPSSASVASYLETKIIDIEGLEHWRLFSKQVKALNPILSNALVAESIIGSIKLSPTQTSTFYQKTAENWSSNVEVLLIAALSNSLSEFFQSELTVAIERHGRDIDSNSSLDQTIGWFTKMYPFFLKPNKDLVQAIQGLKKSIFNLPDMDWFTAISIDPNIGNRVVPSILINWLGRFDSSFEPNSAFEPLGIDVGPTIHTSNPRTSLLELVGLIDQGELRISLSADPLFIDQFQFDILINRINESLEIFINTPLKIAHASWIPSDIPWLGSNDANQFHNFIERAGNFEKILPTTPVQQGLAYRHDLEGESSGKYIQQIEFNIEGNLNPEYIANAFNEVANIHESLRTAIMQSEDGSYVQIVYPSTQMQHLVHDFSHEADPTAKWAETVTNDRKLGFQIQNAPLSRTTIAKLAANQWKLLWTHHHLILDGWSVPIVINDLGKKLTGVEITTPASRSIFWDWLTRQKTLASAQEKSAIWRQRFENIQEPCLVAQLPHTQNQSNEEVTNISEVLEWTMPVALTNNIRSFLKRNGLTLSVFINAAWSYTLANLLDRDDAVHGVTISGRPSELQGSELWVGMFINTLPLYVNCKTDQAVTSWLKEIQENLADLNTAPQDSLSDIQMWTNQSKPLFDSIVVFQNYPIEKNIVEHSDSLKINAAETTEKNEYPLSLYVDDKETIALTLRYDSLKISSNLVHTILEAIITSMNYWSKNENENIRSTNLTDSTSKLNLLKWGSGTKELNLASPAERIYQQAALDPKRIALQEESSLKSITYGDLVASSLKISAHIKHKDFGYEDRICVLGHHRINTVLGMLAVQYAGAAFIPLDPTFPAARLNAIIEDATPSLILVEKACLDHPALLNRPHLCIEEILENEMSIDFYKPELKVPAMALAYILFTSGSTGRPKGVQILNRAFSNALTYFVKSPGIYEDDKLASITTISFDISLLEIFGPLTVGACVHLVSKETAKDGNDFKKYLEDRCISIMQATPSTWKILQAVQTKLPKLRAWCGGEAFPRDLALWMKESFQEVWNLYGPTETTIWSSTYKLSSEEITAGKPIVNTEFIILNKNGDMTLPGAIGELCIAGKGISRGYIAKPGLTAQSFIPNQFSTGETLYRTGDQAYWTEDGNVVILGRLDKQIKINGFRIELGEIESVIRSLDTIKDAVALVVNHRSAPILVAWVINKDKSSISEKTILDHIASKLPNYMVPRHIIFVDEIPLTANGKVNSHALFLPDLLGNTHKRIAKDELEKVVLSILINALSSFEIGPDDHFMEYGGNSLSATIIRGRLERLFKMNLPLGTIFELGSAAQIMELILQKESQKGAALETSKAFIKLSIAKKEQKAAMKSHGLNN